MKRILHLLNEPYPLEDDPRRRFIISVAVGFLFAAFVFLFKPFGLGNVSYTPARMILMYAGYGMVTFGICTLADRFIRPAFPKFFNETEWNTGKNIVWVLFIILLVILGNLFYSNILGFYMVSGSALLLIQITTLMYTILPVTLFTLIYKVTLEKRNGSFVNLLNGILAKPVSPTDSQRELVFPGGNNRDGVRLTLLQFLYAESADAYTDLVYVESGIVKRALIRAALPEIESLVSGKCIARAHHVYLVNLCKVRAVKGNAQGYRLMFDEIEESIPVSRTRRDEIRKKLEVIHP